MDKNELFISAFHSLDEPGTKFRYPGSFEEPPDKEEAGRKTDHAKFEAEARQKDKPIVSLEGLAKVAMDVSRALDGVCTGFHDKAEARAEMLSDLDPSDYL